MPVDRLIAVKRITVGHTPDADDAFMFYAIATGKITSSLLTIRHVIEDIETLNKRAVNHELDVTAISAHGYAYVKDYIILSSGGSFGMNYGPLVIAKRHLSRRELRNCRIAIPGDLTTATLLLKLLIGNFRTKVMNFSRIPKAVLSQSVDAGLVIHEAQISKNTQTHTVVDLGRWWYKMTSGLPLPLGINVASTRSMTISEIREFDTFLRKSIEYGLSHMEDAMKYAMKYARGSPKELIERFVKMYVNETTINMGREGEKSIALLLSKGRDQKILSCNRILFSNSDEVIELD